MVRIGVTQWSLDHGGVEAVHHAARLGFTAIHIDAGDLTSDLLLDKPTLRRAYSQAAQQAGVEIAAIGSGYVMDYGLTHPPDSENARRCWQLLQIAMEAAAQMDVRLVFVPSFRASEIRTEQDLQRTAEVLREACAYAAQADLVVATENTLGLSDNLKLVAAVGHPRFQILIDTQNPVLWGHNPAALIEGLWPHVCPQIHVKDGVNGEMGNAILGAGQAGFAESAEKLRALGFDGVVISENDYHGDREINAARDRAVIAKLFRPNP